MILNNTKFNKKSSGFTIVELLVVIVVIGILAAITIVSYTGVTARANTTKAQTNASSAAKVAEVFYTDETNGGSYPATAAAFNNYTTGFAKLPSGVTVVPGLAGTAGAFLDAPGSIATLWGTTILPADFGNKVTWACVTSCAAPVAGGRITFYDFSASTQSTSVVYVGSASAASTFVAPAS